MKELVTIIGLCLLLLLVGCTENPGVDPPDAGAEADATDNRPDLAACADNLDCRGGEVCRRGECREACDPFDRCTGPLLLCDPQAGHCVQCLDPIDCDRNETCIAGWCSFACQEDGICGAGMFCDEMAGECAQIECEKDNDCQGGMHCPDHRCVPIDDLVCEPGSASCDGNTALNCARDGTRQTRAPCALPMVCGLRAGSAVCVDKICEPFAAGCLDERTAYLCSETGGDQEEIACREGQYCEAAICQNQACTPAERICDGTRVLTCNEAGSEQFVLECEETTNCSASQYGCTCIDARCVTRVCEPNTSQCVGNSVRRCSADGTAFDALVACADDEVCDQGLCR